MADAAAPMLAAEQLGQQLLAVIVPVKGLQSVVSGLTDMMAQAGKIIGTFVEFVGNMIVGPATGLVTAFKQIVGGFAKAGSQLFESFESILKASVKVASGLFELGLAATPAGLKIFSEVVEYAATVLGQVFVPIVTVIVAAIKALADTFNKDLTEAAKKVAGYIVDVFQNNLPTVIKSLLDFADRVASIGAKMLSFVLLTGELIGTFLSKFFGLMERIFGTGMFKDLAKLSEQAVEGMHELLKITVPFAKGRDQAIKDREAEFGKEGHGTFGEGVKDFGKNFKKAYNDELKAISASMAGKANVGFSNIGDVAKQVQMQGFNVDEIQRQQLQKQQEIVDAIKDMDKSIQGINTGAER